MEKTHRENLELIVARMRAVLDDPESHQRDRVSAAKALMLASSELESQRAPSWIGDGPVEPIDSLEQVLKRATTKMNADIQGGR